jgi:hypothetical protein
MKELLFFHTSTSIFSRSSIGIIVYSKSQYIENIRMCSGVCMYAPPSAAEITVHRKNQSLQISFLECSIPLNPRSSPQIRLHSISIVIHVCPDLTVPRPHYPATAPHPSNTSPRSPTPVYHRRAEALQHPRSTASPAADPSGAGGWR